MGAVELARDHGASGVWMSEANGYDAVGLAVLAARSAPELQVTIGPVVAGVRSAAQTAMAASTVAAISTVPPRVALGAGNPRIVSGWHGRAGGNAPGTMIEHVAVLRSALDGQPTAGAASDGFRLAVDAPNDCAIVVAALGPRMLAVGGGCADAVVVNLVPPDAIRAMAQRVADAAAARRRKPPKLIAWMIVGDTGISGPRVLRLLRPYRSAVGYTDVLAAAGVHSKRPTEWVLRRVTGLGAPEAAVERALEYVRAGVDEVVAVGSPSDPAVGRSIAALAELAGWASPTPSTEDMR